MLCIIAEMKYSVLDQSPAAQIRLSL